MQTFQPGDVVRRVGTKYLDLIPGNDYTVGTSLYDGAKITIVGLEGMFGSEQFELVKAAPAKPKGLKYDNGKLRWGLVMRGMGAALQGVVAVATFGARKYADDSWQGVEDARKRYTDALYRHLHEVENHGELAKDEESGLLHWFHIAWNALALAWFAAKSAREAAATDAH
jgi:hypothetical protein